MTQVFFSSSFKRAFKKRIAGRKVEEKFWQRVEIFTKNPHDPRLKTHKLSGKLADLWSFTLEYDLRIVFYFLPNNRVMFENIGTHDEVY